MPKSFNFFEMEIKLRINQNLNDGAFSSTFGYGAWAFRKLEEKDEKRTLEGKTAKDLQEEAEAEADGEASKNKQADLLLYNQYIGNKTTYGVRWTSVLQQSIDTTRMIIEALKKKKVDDPFKDADFKE